MSDLAGGGPPTTTRLWQKLGAEMVGTFALVFVGCGAIVVDSLTAGTVTHVGVCLAFGLTIMTMVYATGHICGAHFNPAVTIAFAVIGRFPRHHVVPYVAAQLVAALLAAGALRLAFGNVADLGATAMASGVTAGVGLGVEIALTFFLMFVITSVATDGRAVSGMAGWAIGGTVLLGSLVGGPMTGSSMNPARSLGPAIVSGGGDTLWAYILGPLIGASLGAVAYHLLSLGQSARSATGAD